MLTIRSKLIPKLILEKRESPQIYNSDTMIFCLMQVLQPCKFANHFANYELQTYWTMNSSNYEIVEQP